MKEKLARIKIKTAGCVGKYYKNQPRLKVASSADMCSLVFSVPGCSFRQIHQFESFLMCRFQAIFFSIQGCRFYNAHHWEILETVKDTKSVKFNKRCATESTLQNNKSIFKKSMDLQNASILGIGNFVRCRDSLLALLPRI